MKIHTILLLSLCPAFLIAMDRMPDNYLVQVPEITSDNNQPIPQSHEQIIDQDKEETKRILTTFMSMVGSFAHILSDPHNPQVVGSQMAKIFSGLIVIGMEAFKGSKIGDDDAIPLTVDDIDDQLVAQLKEAFILYAIQLNNGECIVPQ